MWMGNEEIAREYIESWNRRDFDRLDSFVAEDAEIVNFDGTTGIGPAGSRAQAEMYANAFPDGKLEILSMAAAGEVVVAEIVGRGTNDGPFGEIPATHRSVELPYASVITIRDGKVIRDRLYGDQVTMLQQLGLMPEMAQT
jgi:steroid delta-isomerase-like uncharacterized protein